MIFQVKLVMVPLGIDALQGKKYRLLDERDSEVAV
jgi:hypothetical protein